MNNRALKSFSRNIRFNKFFFPTKGFFERMLNNGNNEEEGYCVDIEVSLGRVSYSDG